VHLSNSVWLRRPLVAGQALRIEVECGSLVPHQKGQAFTLHTRIYRRGEAVWDGDSVYLKRGVRSESAAPSIIEMADGADPRVPLLAREARWQLPPQLGRDYAKASGDFNPIHLHVLAAKAFGFPRAIAHGMWTLARTLAALHPVKTLAAGHAHGDFKTPLYIPGDATLWSAAPSPLARAFEVRDLAGDRPHLRGHFEWELP
jgi:acyl dehydratase